MKTTSDIKEDKIMDINSLITQAEEFEKNQKTFVSRSDKIRASKEAKEIILSINEVYKINKDEKLMEIMKRMTVIKIKLEKRLRIR